MVHTGTSPTMPSLSSRQPLQCSHALLSSLETSPMILLSTLIVPVDLEAEPRKGINRKLPLAAPVNLHTAALVKLRSFLFPFCLLLPSPPLPVCLSGCSHLRVVTLRIAARCEREGRTAGEHCSTGFGLVPSKICCLSSSAEGDSVGSSGNEPVSSHRHLLPIDCCNGFLSAWYLLFRV